MNTLHNLPYLADVNGARRLIVAGAPTLLLGGELHNSSASSLDYMDREVWPRIESIGCNMILPSLSWELVEPDEGQFDFSLIDGLIEQARNRDIFLVPLWFGAYKNAQSNYAPAWVKMDMNRFPRAEARLGSRTEAITVLSQELLDADSRAFAAVMRRIREVDPNGTTVVMMQVENEVGQLRGSRDLCALAQAAYEGPVPSTLTTYLNEHRSELQPGLLALWDRQGALARGTWADVFGNDPFGDEVFMAWHFASYVAAVAEAGFAHHAIPMYANAWLVQHEGQVPGGYPSGGPVAHMMDVWRAAAPNLAFLAPDIYLPDFARQCQWYTQSRNPLFIPEMVRSVDAAANAFYAVGEHAAIGVAPFGIDGLDVTNTDPGIADPANVGNPIAALVASAHAGSSAAPLSPACLLKSTYRLLADMTPLLLSVSPASVRGFLEDATVPESPNTVIDLGDYRITIEWLNAVLMREGKRSQEDPFIIGGGLIVLLPSGEYIIAGFGFRARFSCPAVHDAVVEFLAIDDGDIHKGEWIQGRRLNGDEYRIDLPLRSSGLPHVRRVTPYHYSAQS